MFVFCGTLAALCIASMAWSGWIGSVLLAAVSLSWAYLVVEYLKALLPPQCPARTRQQGSNSATTDPESLNPERDWQAGQLEHMLKVWR